MKCNIDDIFGYLSWNNAPEVQSMGIEMAKKIKFLSVLIMPIEDKSVWENCAKILASKSDDELDRYFIKLFEWIKDMNWPGADIIYRRLSLVSRYGFPSNRIWAIINLLDRDNSYSRWKNKGVEIEHYLVDRFGAEETIKIQLSGIV